jgi:outer membrane lipoprotein SlyB
MRAERSIATSVRGSMQADRLGGSNESHGTYACAYCTFGRSGSHESAIFLQTMRLQNRSVGHETVSEDAMNVRYALLGLLCLVSACAAQPEQGGESEVRYGRVTRIEAVSLEGDHHLGLGAIFGAVAGGGLGHQIGGGTGRDVATVAGALGGAYAGNAVQNKYADRQPGQHVIVQLNNGVAVGITQPVDPSLRVDDRVRIDGSGTNARVVRM